MMIHAFSRRRFSRARRALTHASTSRLALTSLALSVTLGLAAPITAEPAAIVGGQWLEAQRLDEGWALHTSELGTLAPVASQLLPFATDHQVYVHRLMATESGWLITATSRSENESRLVVLSSHADGIKELPSPLTTGRTLLQPTPILDGDEPAAVLWIEGPSPRESKVLASRWSGAGWAAPELISPQGPGTQIALDAVRLADGSLLAVWAAFDGDDDEIVWSRSTAVGEWSKPQPITANSVPDVTPALIATEKGAIVAWSAYDGNDYRIFTSSFDGESWTDAHRHGERGSVFPSFAPTGDRLLVYKQTAPAAWRASRLSADGSLDRTLSLEASVERPVIVASDSEGVTLRSADAEKRAVKVSWTESR